MSASAPWRTPELLKCGDLARTRIVQRRLAFTLIELLIVIALISLIVSIALPSLAKSRDSARALKCGVNHRQLMAAMLLYANDFKDRPPMPNWASQDPARGWLYRPPIVGRLAAEARETGLLWPYINSNEIYRCPMDKGPFLGTMVLTSYLMNGAMSGYGRATWSFAIDRFRPNSLIFWEADEGLWNDGSSFPSEGFTKRHARAASVSVIDGSTRPMDQTRYNELLTQSPGPLWCAPDQPDGH